MPVFIFPYPDGTGNPGQQNPLTINAGVQSITIVAIGAGGCIYKL